MPGIALLAKYSERPDFLRGFLALRWSPSFRIQIFELNSHMEYLYRDSRVGEITFCSHCLLEHSDLSTTYHDLFDINSLLGLTT